MNILRSHRLSRLAERLAERLVWWVDRFLRLQGITQAILVVWVMIGLISAFSLTVAITGGLDGAMGAVDYLWWALGRFSDGGTMYADEGWRVRGIAVVVTWTAIFTVQFLTGAVTAHLSERLHRLRTGHSPMLDNDHVLVLGFGTPVLLMARELARSHQKVILVVLSEGCAEEMTHDLASALRIPRHRLRIEARSGDPRDEHDLLRVRADRARTIVIAPPSRLDDEEAFRWSFSTLLAVRRVVGDDFDGNVIVETRHAGRADIFEAVSDPTGVGSRPLRLLQVVGDDVMARVLSKSIRQAGIYFVLRELLSFRGCELYLEAVPRGLAGLRFDEASARMSRGILVGLRPKGGRPVLNPLPGEPISLGDHLIVLEEDRGAFRIGERPPTPPPGSAASRPPRPMRVVVLGDNGSLGELVSDLVRTLPAGSEVLVLAQAVVPEIPPCAVQVSWRQADPLVVARDPPTEILAADAMVILGLPLAHDTEADSTSLEILVCLRHAERSRGIRIPHLITELRCLGSAMHVRAATDDFLVSRELLALLVAGVALEPDLHGILHDDLLGAGGNDVCFRPLSDYGQDLSFGQVMAIAMQRGELAIGLYRESTLFVAPDIRDLMEGRAENDDSSPVTLVPPRDLKVGNGDLVVVLARETPAL